MAKKIPSDIKEVYRMLKGMKDDLSDLMGLEVEEWLDDLRDDFNNWKSGEADEPDWEAYRESMNEICYDDGMPALFVEE